MRRYKNEIICDMAEYYGVFNPYALPFSLFCTLVLGLRPDSRLMLALMEQEQPISVLLQAMAVDDLNFLAWCKTKDAQKGRNKPRSIYELLTKREEKPRGFDSIEEFEAARADIIRNAKNG